MKLHPLAHLIPSSNEFKLPTLRGTPLALTNAVEAIYDAREFQGCFTEDAGGWQARIVRYDNDEFMAETEGPKLFSEVYDSLKSDEGDGCHVYSQLAFDGWKRDGKGAEQPYSVFQDSGICVDSSNVEMKWGLIGYLVANSGGQFSMPWGPSHYSYGERGYCGQGWTMGACATVNSRVGICPAMPIEAGSNRLDFDGENKHERMVTSTWCRSGIPGWLKDWTIKTFPFDDTAITKFDGSLDALRRLVSEGGQFHHGGNSTAGNRSPDSWKRIGGHAQTMFGGDWSERTIRFFADLGYKLTVANDFWVANHQTWGGSWSGATAEKFWPPWWGAQPQGAWISRASSLLPKVNGYAYLPRLKWFPGSVPGPVPGPVDVTPLTGTVYAEHGGPIRGTLKAGDTEYVIVPVGGGIYGPVRKGM